jgi:hypothetical protein
MSNVINVERLAVGKPAIGNHSNRRPGVRRAVYTVAEVSRLLSLSLGGTYELVRSGVILAASSAGAGSSPSGPSTPGSTRGRKTRTTAGTAADGFRAEDTGRDLPRLLA